MISRMRLKFLARQARNRAEAKGLPLERARREYMDAVAEADRAQQTYIERCDEDGVCPECDKVLSECKCNIILKAQDEGGEHERNIQD